MSEGTPDSPKGPPPPSDRGKLPQQPRGGSMAYGIVSGAAALYVLYMWATMAVGGPYGWSNSILAGPATFIPMLLYLLGSILLAVNRETSRFGAGLLIGLGIFTLLGGGLCVGSLAGLG